MDTLLEITKTAVGKAIVEKFAEVGGTTEAAMVAIIMERGPIARYFVETVEKVIDGLAAEDKAA